MATQPSVDPATLPGPASNRNGAASITTGASVVLADPTGQFWPTGIPVTIESAGGEGVMGALDDLTDVDAATPVDGNALVWSDAAGEWVPGDVTPAATVRETATYTTASLAAGASESGTITLANGYRLYRITCSAPCRVRLYSTAAKQAADLSRPVGTDPTGDHGLILEFVATSGLLAADLSPLVDGFDGKTTPDGAIPITIGNTTGGAATLTATFVYLRSE